ncbi:hypothetical protein BB561_006777 [Smittium simulii]|uniref:Reverse transcriptase domain-containing protein n=1 Tax=Smittium simulii TaxID=133385 RepID=A0A2T9Y1P4_9FUNG|nr:hypothetical protein BB561_006777 [Smittium simulii]
MDTNSLVNSIIKKSNCILNYMNINKPVVNGKTPKLPKKLLKAINARQFAFKKMLFETDLVLRYKQLLKFKELKFNALKLLKSHLKKGSTATKAVINKNLEFIDKKKESLVVWTNNFSRLAQTISIGNKNFELFPLNKINVFGECNITPRWNNITTALKTTPDNKATRMSSITNLFDIYINDIFNWMAGVSAPGMKYKIPGLLFADDAVILAESADELQNYPVS